MESVDYAVVVSAEAGVQLSGNGDAFILCIVTDGSGIGHSLFHAVMQAVDDGRLARCDVNQVVG